MHWWLTRAASFQQSVTGGEFGKEDPNAGPFVPSKGLTSEGAGPERAGEP
jgi:hypothetical protein